MNTQPIPPAVEEQNRKLCAKRVAKIRRLLETIDSNEFEHELLIQCLPLIGIGQLAEIVRRCEQKRKQPWT